MANTPIDAVGDTTSTTGTADFVIDGVALTGCVSFASALTNGLTYGYRCETSDKTSWEVGSGTWTSATGTLSRTTVSRSSNGGAKVSFASGAKSIGIVIQAQDFASAATDANISMSDITTNDVSITKHGFVPKAPNDSTKYLNGLGAWATITSGATLGANTFTDKQTITQASANTGVLASTGYSLTGSDATTMVDFAGTWNTSGNPIVQKFSITNTASGSTSKFQSFLAGASGVTEVFSVDKTGMVAAGGTGVNYLVSANANDNRASNRRTGIGTRSAGSEILGLYASTKLCLEFNAGLSATFDGAIPVGFSATTADGNLTVAHSYGGAAGTMALGTGAAGSTAGDLKLRGLRFATTFTVGTLPAASTAGDGMTYRVTDLNAPALGSAPSGSGSTKGLVTSNGSSYTVTQFG